MDWLSVAKLVAQFAPVLGGVLGGFIPVPGGAIAGQAIGSIIAKAFGVPATPAGVAGALASNPNEVILAKLTAAADEARAMWPAYAQAEEAYYKAQAAIADSVNVTMRAELGHESVFFTGWRPAAGWVFVIFSTVFGGILAWAAVRGVFGDDKPLKTLTDAWPIFAAYLGTLSAMVGVYVIGRSAEKAKAIEQVGTVQVKPAAPSAKK